LNYFINKVIWITGASSGIGYALCKELSKVNGVKLIISARNKEKLEQVALECSNNNVKVLILPFSLEDYTHASAWVEKAITTFGRVDILINNGGISQRSWAADTPIEIDKKIFETNFFGTIALTKALLPQLIKQQSAHIVTVSSIAGKFGFYLRSAYSASKHALHGFFDSLRLEVEKHNINVTLICPGKIKTNISLHAITESGKEHNVIDEATQNGMAADKCARLILQAIAKKKQEVYIGKKEIIPVYIKRFFPNFLNTILRKQKIE